MINNSKEYIICAAIHYQDNSKHPNQPKNIASGIVIAGRRHSNAFHVLMQFIAYDRLEAVTDGFITSEDRFVDRIEAGKLAYLAGQIKKEVKLISDDLY